MHMAYSYDFKHPCLFIVIIYFIFTGCKKHSLGGVRFCNVIKHATIISRQRLLLGYLLHLQVNFQTRYEASSKKLIFKLDRLNMKTSIFVQVVYNELPATTEQSHALNNFPH